jgi:uncharacterized RDD family membrane protein YckC
MMFNWLTRGYLNRDYWFLRWNKRVKSLTVEMWYTLAVFFPYVATPLILTMIFRDAARPDFSSNEWVTIVPFSVLMVGLFNKDFFGGQSAVHRKLGYKVVDSKTKETASKLQCLLRNLTAPIWPIEIIFILMSPKRRLGDLIAGTMLADVPESEPESILADIRDASFDGQAKLTLLISVVCVVILSILLSPA